MGEKLGASNFESMPSGAENVQGDIENSSEQQEVLDSKRIVERAENNINDIAEDLAQDLASENNGTIDESEHRELVKQSLASMAKETVTEADNDGIRTPEEQDDVSEVFQTALVFGSMEQGSGTKPKENIIAKLHEDETTASDLEDVINSVADAEVILEDGSSLAESAAEILYSAEQEDKDAKESEAEQSNDLPDSQETEEQERMRQSKKDGELINTTVAILAVINDIPDNLKKYPVDNAKLMADLRAACGDSSNETFKELLDKLENSDNPAEECKELEDSDFLMSQLKEMPIERVLLANTDTQIKKELVEYQMSEGGHEKEILEAIPQIVEDFGEDYVKKISSKGYFRISELHSLSQRAEGGNHEEFFQQLASSEIAKIVNGDNMRQKVNLDVLIDNAETIQEHCNGSELTELLNERFSKNKLSAETMTHLSALEKTFGSEVMQNAKKIAMQEMESRITRSSTDKGWLDGLSTQYYDDTLASLKLMAELDDEELNRASEEFREQMYERIRSIDSGTIMDVCLENETRISVIAGVCEAIGDTRPGLSESLSIFMRAYSSTSPELSSYSKNIFSEICKTMQATSEEGVDSAKALEKYEDLIELFESNVPTYRKLAKAECTYYKLAVEGNPKKPLFNIEEFLKEFPEIDKDKEADEVYEDLEKIISQELLTVAVRSNNLQLRSFLANAAEASGQTLGIPESKRKEVEDVLGDFQDVFGLSEAPTPAEALQIMNSVLAERDQKKRESVIEDPQGSGRFVLKEPIKAKDPKKGFTQDYLDFLFQDGFNCPEALGYGGYSDATSGDADFSASNPDIIERENKGEIISIGEQLRNSITQGRPDALDGDGYGHIKLVFRQDERFSVLSSDEKSEPSEKAVYRIIPNNGHAIYNNREATFIGVRTGLGTLDADAFVIHDGKEEQQDLDKRCLRMLKFEIAKSGCYTPIVGQESGEVIFTPQEYDDMRKKVFGGIRAYDYGTGLKSQKSKISEGASMSEESLRAEGSIYESTFEPSGALRIDDSVLESLGITDVSFDSVVEEIDANEQETMQTNNAIVMKILDIVEQSNLGEDTKEAFRRASSALDDVKPFSDASSAGIFGTGSTARGVNEPGDGDYDFLISLDGQLLKRDGKEIVRVLNDGLQPGAGEKVDFNTKGLDIRGLKATAEELGVPKLAQAESGNPEGVATSEPREIELDISLEPKNDRTRLSTNMILGQFYEDLMHKDAETGKQVIANVRIAKKIMKKYKCYKKRSSAGYMPGRGGIGGIGVENLILQNNGSLHDAAESFVEASRAAVRQQEGNENLSDDEIDTILNGYAKIVKECGDRDAPKLPKGADEAFSTFRGDFLLFDRGQNFPSVDTRVNVRDQHEGGRDTNYAFDDLIDEKGDSTRRFEPGGWIGMYSAFRDILDAWPADNSQSQSAISAQ